MRRFNNLQQYAIETRRHLNNLMIDFKSFIEFRTEMREFQDELRHNGVAEAINKLNKEVFGKKKDVQLSNFWSTRSMALMFGNEQYTPEQEATLAGKVDAIIEHLGLDVNVKPEEKIPAKVVAKKVVKKTKKGRK